MPRADAQFGNSNKKQTLDFHKNKGICYRNFLKRQIKLLKISEKTEVTSEVWRRDEQVPELFLQLHQEDGTATTKSKKSWTRSVT